MIKVSQDRYNDHVSDSDGFCVECESIIYGGIDADAEEDECESCGEHSVMSFEIAIIHGEVQIEGEDD